MPTKPQILAASAAVLAVYPPGTTSRCVRTRAELYALVDGVVRLMDGVHPAINFGGLPGGVPGSVDYDVAMSDRRMERHQLVEAVIAVIV